MKQKVLTALKPKAASYGFNANELDEVAQSIAGMLKDDATEEQITAAVDSALPFLAQAQKMATRVINENKPKPDPKPAEPAPKPKPKEEEKPVEDEKYKTLFEKLDQLANTVTQLTTEKATTSRKTAFEAVLEGILPSQKASQLSSFDRMTFKDDADFEAFKADKIKEVAAIKQELADNGLASISQPLAGGASNTEEDDFIKRMADMNKKEK